jgi:hypothetical protein
VRQLTSAPFNKCFISAGYRPQQGSSDPSPRAAQGFGPQPGYGYRFPYSAFRALGVIHIALAVILFGVAVAHFVINYPHYLKWLAPSNDYYYYGNDNDNYYALWTEYTIPFDAACFSALAPAVSI